MRFPNLKETKIASFFYKILFYFELGKGTIARFYSWIPEIIIVIGGFKYLLGIEFSKIQLAIIFSLLVVCFACFGYFIKKTGLYDTDQRIKAERDPVLSELLEGSRILKGRFK